MLHDVRFAIRLLRTNPAFSAVAIATIALAVGANAAMFSFVNGALLSPLPYPDSNRIVRVLERSPTGGLNSISTLNYLDWAMQNGVFEYTAAEAGWRATLTGGSEPIVIRGARVSAQYFEIFGVKPARGRTFLPGEDQPGKDHVVLLSHALWENRFGADPAILERNVVLNGEAHTVVGILPKGGPFDRASAQIWKPLAFQPSNMTRDFRWLGASALLKSGVSLQSARAGMNLVAQRLADASPVSNKGWGVSVDRLGDVLIGPDLRTAVTILFAATLFVLLIGCVNVANLTLARSASRDGEMAVRAALGAGRRRLVQQFLTESVVISVIGGVVGAGVGYAMLKWIQSLIPSSALPPAVDISMDVSVLVFTLTVSVVAGVVIGAAAAARSTNRGLTGALKESRHGTTAASPGRRARGVLVVAEIALAFVLLVASGLLMRSFFKLLDVHPGFVATNVLTAGLPIVETEHPNPAELNIYLASLRAAIEAVPGVQKTALTSALPLEGWGLGARYSIAGRETDRNSRRIAFFKIVSPSYVDALGIKLRSGRALRDDDSTSSAPVALINEAMARREFPNETPIGRRIVVQEIIAGRTELGRDIAWEIVGVMADEKISGLGDEVSAGVYVSNEQSPTYGISLIVQTGVPPLSVQKDIRSAVDRINKNQAFSDIRTLDEIVVQSMLGNRVMNTLLVAFASIALLLAAVGIYGVVSYTAATRTYELGIRAALGAGAGDLRTLVFKDGMRLAVTGLAIGLAATFAVTRLLSSMLYGVSTHDPLTIVAVAAMLSGVAGLACLLPARRIARIDPVKVLRS